MIIKLFFSNSPPYRATLHKYNLLEKKKQESEVTILEEIIDELLDFAENYPILTAIVNSVIASFITSILIICLD